MKHAMKIEFADDLFARVRDEARRSGQSPEQWVTDQVDRLLPSPERRAAALENLLKRTENVQSSHADNSHNDAIDRDLAREYGNVDQSDAA